MCMHSTKITLYYVKYTASHWKKPGVCVLMAATVHLAFTAAEDVYSNKGDFVLCI